MGFPDRLRKLREAKGMSQDGLADALGIPRSTITNYENADDDNIRLPRRERLERIADFFGVSVDYLLGRTDNPSPSFGKEKPVNRAFLELPEGVTEEEKEFLKKQLDLQLEIFRSLKKKNSKN